MRVQLVMLIGLVPAALSAQQPPRAGTATAATTAANRAVSARLNLADGLDMEEARRGRLAQIPGGKIIAGDGHVIYDAASYDFLNAAAPDTANPALWRQSRMQAEHGLFQVVPGIYQVRGYDVSVMTLIRGQTGWIVVDPLSTRETAAAALTLANQTLGPLHVSAVVYSHSHGDHFGGVRGIVNESDVNANKIPIVAPKGFTFEAVSENLLAGQAMSRRAAFQFGADVPHGPAGQVGTGLGQALPSGNMTLIKPTVEVEPGAPPMALDGVTFEFIDAAQSEAPAEFMFYLPQFRALSTTEVATSTFHNVLTPRGAKVRDTLGWSKAIDKVLRSYGDRSDVVFASHNWPKWGGARVRSWLENQRDTYRYIHDQSVRLANGGATLHEVGEEVGEPVFSRRDLTTRGYYGTLNHNAKAVYQLYFGWWDGVPANYNPHPPVEEAKRYVAAMGGVKKALATGIKAFNAGDYRWSSRVFNHIVFANPADKPARDWLAASYEQQGFQAESGAWRNYFLRAALELRGNNAPPQLSAANAEFIAAVPSAQLLDSLAARFNPAKAKRTGYWLQLSFPDRSESFTLHVREAVVIPREGELLSAPTATMTLNRTAFDRLLTGQLQLQAAMASGEIGVTGDATAIGAFFQSLDGPAGAFNVVTP